MLDNAKSVVLLTKDVKIPVFNLLIGFKNHSPGEHCEVSSREHIGSPGGFLALPQESIVQQLT